jgi:4-hydroxy-tetrahydrodipicolinate synthase
MNLGPIIAAAVTPRRPDEHSIDLGATLELIDFLQNGGVDGVALLGSTGEFLHFMLEDRSRMLEFAVKRSRVPLLVNAGHSMLDGAILLGQEAADAGVAGVLIMPPYYFRYDQESIRCFLLRFAEIVSKLVPVYLYNIPCFSNEIAFETAASLLNTGLFAGMKDSSGNWDYFEKLAALPVRSPLKLFMGDDRFYARARIAGADGAVSGVACAIPELMARLDKAIRDADTELTNALNSRLQEYIERIGPFPAPVGIKESVRLRKIKTGAFAAPLGEPGDRRLAEFAGWFKNWLPEVLKECKR